MYGRFPVLNRLADKAKVQFLRRFELRHTGVLLLLLHVEIWQTAGDLKLLRGLDAVPFTKVIDKQGEDSLAPWSIRVVRNKPFTLREAMLLAKLGISAISRSLLA